MKSVEKSGNEQENFGEKLRKLGKRSGHITPVAPFCRPKESNLLAASIAASHTTTITGTEQQVKDFIFRSDDNFRDSPFHIPCVSVRKLGAALWELHNNNLPLDKMYHGVNAAPPRLRRLHQRQSQQLFKDKVGVEPNDSSLGSPELAGSSSGLRRQLATSLMQHHHRSSQRTNRVVQPISPASSMEIAPYNPVAATPTSSMELKGRTGDRSCSLKTSTELLKVLNRIWSLEEQHVSNTSLVKALKKDLDHARSRIKELTREQHADHYEMDELMNHIIKKDKLAAKNKERDRINITIESMRSELENERNLRKRSESLHRKLARELHEVKTTLGSVSNDLEKERKSRDLLEELCDEFAWGIKDYETELHAMRKISEKNWDEGGNHDQLILHVAESWLDQRIETNLQTGENESALEKLRSEIDTFLRTKRNGKTKINGKDHTFRRSSLESFPLNTIVSAPKDEDDNADSAGSDYNCFELDKMNEILKEKQVKKKLEFSGKRSSLQVKFEEHMAQAMSHGESSNLIEGSEQIKTGEINISKKRDESEGITGLNSNYMIDNLIRHHYLLPDSGNTHSNEVGSSTWRSHPSPVCQWTAKLPSHDLEISESSSKLPQDLKQNSLKSKLLEARIKGQRSRRLKASVIPSQNE